MQSKLDTVSKVSKYGPEKTTYLDNFRAVWKLSINNYQLSIINYQLTHFTKAHLKSPVYSI